MKKYMFCMLFLLAPICSFATIQPTNVDTGPVLSFLDTVIVCSCEKNVLYFQSSGSKNSVKKDKACVEILVKFSNGMSYDYIRSEEDMTKEISKKGPDHIYNASIGDVVVVKVVVTQKVQKIADFVANLSAW